jgi:hypothetical protein
MGGRRMDKVIETLEELTQITSIMPETRFQMALTMAITDLNRAHELEAEAAAMRGALEQAHDLYECSYHVGVYTHMGYTERREKWNDEAQEILANMQQALAPDAGKALLERVQRLEAEAAAMREALEKIAHPIPWLQKDAENKGYVLNGSAAVYLAKDANWLKDTAKQALAALEGGADDA